MPFARTVARLGGGGHFHHPKYVWSPAGGWWGNTKNGPRNTVIAVGLMAAASAMVWTKGRSIEVSALHSRVFPPAPLDSTHIQQCQFPPRSSSDVHLLSSFGAILWLVHCLLATFAGRTFPQPQLPFFKLGSWLVWFFPPQETPPSHKAPPA